MLVEGDESLVGELEGAQSGVRSQSTVPLEVPSLTPVALVCVPDEPVLMLPRAVGADLLSQEESPPVLVEERH